jgi:hypothetical protein
VVRECGIELGWPKAHRTELEQVSGKMSLISLGISILALFVSIFSAFYSAVDERYHAKVLFSLDQPEIVTEGEKLKISHPQTVSVLNNGNRAISIVQLSSIVQPTKKQFDQLEKFNCEMTYLGGNHFLRAEDEDFVPFSIKAGEVETKTYYFIGDVSDEDAGRFSDETYHLMSCMLVRFVWAEGSYTEMIPHTWSPKSSGGTRTFIETKFFHNADPVQIIKTRWPFKPVPLASE